MLFVIALKLIDAMHLGRDRVIGAWLRDGAIVDPGPASCLPTLLEALDGAEPESLLLTHIHLDHAGAAGSLVARFPALRVYVHEVGAAHLIDPARLLDSAARLYGDAMKRLWGEVLPVPEANLVALAGGETVEGLEVLASPGHAAHHVCYLDPASGDAFVGDVAGVRIPPGERTVMPTPPPEIDVEAWIASIDRLRRWAPERLRLTHFGEADDAPAQLARARAALSRQAELAREGDRAAFMATVEAAIDDQPAAAAERMRAAMPPEQVWLGLERYWRKRSE